jgi:hypothetical protein
MKTIYSIERKSLITSQREHNRIFRKGFIDGLTPAQVAVNSIPKYAAPFEVDSNPSSVALIAVKTVEIFFGLFVLLCMVGVLGIGAFIRGR